MFQMTVRGSSRWLIGCLGLWGALCLACAADRGGGDGLDGGLPPPPGKQVAPSVFGPGADPMTPGQFTGGTGGAAPQVVYPFDGVMLAKNINQMRLAFAAAPGQSYFRVVLDSPTYQQTIYLGAAACKDQKCSYLVDDKVWSAVAHTSGGRATLTVSGTGGAGQAVGAAAPLTLLFSPQDVRGGLYYFSTSDSGLMRLPFGGTTPVPYLLGNGNGGVKNCVGCHGVSRDGKKVAAVFDLPDGYAGIVDGADPTRFLLQPVESDGDRLWNFASFSPDGARLITVWDGVMSLRDGSTGKLIKNVGGALLGGRAAMPEWSPDGKSIVFVRVSGKGRLGSDFGSPDVKAGDWFLGDAGDIAVLPYNSGDFGPAVTVVASTATEWHFYPTFSPDSGWILFNSAATPGCASDSAAQKTGFNLKLVHCVSYDQTAARLRLVRALANQTPMELLRATHLTNKTTSWPKFAPFQQGNLVFFTFSAKFDYGFVIQQEEVKRREDSYRPQLWMSGIDLGQVAPGADPSYPPFWLPFQDAETNNHEALWTTDLACTRPKDCGDEFTCLMGVCVPQVG